MTGDEVGVPERQALAATFASDEERDEVVTILADAYAKGRITSDELSLRTTQALAARTHGDLAPVLHGLVAPQVRKTMSPGKVVAAVVMTVLMSPFLFLGLAFTLGGSDGGDRVFGLVVLALLGPGLFAIWRWAWPSRESD